MDEAVDTLTLGIIGLGYVGLPLAAAFSEHVTVIAFDHNEDRIAQLSRHEDRTQEMSTAELRAKTKLNFTSDAAELAPCDIYIVCVPTPVDDNKMPDLSALESASATVGATLSKGNIVVYESTVFPGCTQEICVPILEAHSKLIHNRDFTTGYSPERINPGDKSHRIADIVKVTSGSTDETAERVDALYAMIITAGTFKASSIAVAEAAKVIENTQRDVNIALMNELAMIFNHMGLNTQDILAAARTKWNFLNFTPGLVGGHCIGVDPYYLTYRAKQFGYHPDVILAGRAVNDAMPSYIVGRLVNTMMRKGCAVVGSKILILGLTFKENCPDLRNSKVIDIVTELRDLNAQVDIHDPRANKGDITALFGQAAVNLDGVFGHYHAVVLAVAHDEYKAMGAEAMKAFGKDNMTFFDVKAVFAAGHSDERL